MLRLPSSNNWREERKKNYLREKVSMLQGLKEMVGREVVDAATKARRQQLKDRFSKRQRPLDNGQPNTQYQNGRFSKKQRRTSGCLANFHIENQREPSLLKKLLSSDISRCKKHLMQVFRFMVMNSFFRNLPEKPLKFPVVVVKEAGDEGLKGESSNGGIEKIADITNKNGVLFGGDSVGCDRNDVECNGGEEEGEITD
ncbi:hypothetical protein OROGR_004457 [Orobanche gracilis]